ncbi:LysR family transcriptional regulator [Fusibacter ferrireducens]|uniref:LysR family transcriptional regulator n=1 Tax=Fusibacter ferrireducens TaxID=2785058 RepID=A0ABR9ZTX3_9FIRM|nr:LysR family transcriptional regulator [Fusibacter ferrireducens]MBF4693330.1 LysR family transcriptional regulator [Fusibacter ferrireducens]
MSQNSPQNTLYYIDAILKYSNYGKAAKALYVSQPYLTQVIKRIEKQLECELINRSELPYRLTEQGKIYYEYLTSLENRYSRFLREIAAVAGQDKQVIKIGILPSLGTYLLPLLLPNFFKTHPTCKVELFEDLPEKNEKRTLSGELDFWIGQNSRNISPNLSSTILGKNSYSVIIPRSCALYREGIAIIDAGTYDMKTLLSQNLILTRKGSSIRSQIDQLLSVYKITPKIILESTEIYTIQRLAMNNIGLTFVPESIRVSPCPEKYNLYTLPVDELSLDFFIAYHSDRSLSETDLALINAFSIDTENAFSLGE